MVLEENKCIVSNAVIVNQEPMYYYDDPEGMSANNVHSTSV